MNAAGVRGSFVAISVALGIAALVWPALQHAVWIWAGDPEFGFGFAVLPTFVALIWLRRRAIRRSVSDGARAGLVIAACALILYVVAERAQIHALVGLSISPLLWGIVIYLWGWTCGRVLAFPLAFLWFGLCLYQGLLSSVGFFLQGVTANGASLVGQSIGLPVVQEGLVIRSPSFAFVVAEACSGMSSLLALLALASLWVYAVKANLPSRVAVMLAVTPIVILGNTLRVASVLVVANGFGEDAALGFFHGASSLLVFGLAVLGLLTVSRLAGCELPDALASI